MNDKNKKLFHLRSWSRQLFNIFASKLPETIHRLSKISQLVAATLMFYDLLYMRFTVNMTEGMDRELTWAGEPFPARAELDRGHSFSVAC